jgi:hypothetical protein
MKRYFFYLVMICMVLELSYINSKSLTYLVEDFDFVGKIFAVIGAMTFSMVTLLVMRTSSQKWVKYVFPSFDILLVFCAFNLRFANDLMANPIAFVLTIFLALFTGLITYSLGIIDINRSIKDAEMELLKGSLVKNANEIERLQSELAARQGENNSLKSYINEQETEVKKYKYDIDYLKRQLKNLESDIMTYRRSHLLSERSRILKKKNSNRTAAELKILEESEVFKLVL